jgi:predicted nucleic-acid-binding protein
VIALDTNVIVRYIMQDDEKQSASASRVIDSLTDLQPGFVPLVALVELSWVLSSAYGLQRPQVELALEGLLRTRELVIDQSVVVWRALRTFRDGNADFADCVIASAAVAAGCDRIMTFDRKAARDCGMTLVN